MVSQAESSNPHLDAWREQVHLSALPVFARTVRDVSVVANSIASSASDLSQVVGKDPGLTTKVVRIANSPVFNLQNRSVASIPEAVVLIGFDSIRDLAVSVTVLEEFRKGRSPERVGSLMAQGFHTATQARYLAGQLADTPVEEVFLAGLLQDLGAMAFWAHGDDEAEDLERQLAGSTQSVDPKVIEEQVLGFSLNELSLALVEEWNLGKLLGRSLTATNEKYAGVFEKGKKPKDAPLTSICTGRLLARAVEQERLDEPETQAVLERLAEQTGRKTSEIRSDIEENFKEAAELAELMGVAPGRWLGQRELDPIESQRLCNEADEAGNAEQIERQQLQLAEFLESLSTRLEQGGTRDALMQSVVLAVHELLGFDQAQFALFTPDRKRMLVKYVAGLEAEKRLGSVLSPGAMNVPLNAESANRLVVREEQDDLICVVNVCLRGKSVGVLYGRLCQSNAASSEAHQKGFLQLAQQIGLVIALAAA